MTSLADFLRCALALLAASLLAACQPSGIGDSEKKSAVVPQASSADGTAGAPAMPQEFEADGIMPKRYSVVPYGYNYTDNYISSFSVNGAGGGNLEVSIPTAGGGKYTCCMTLVSGLPLDYEFVVKWTRDRKRWCEQTVKLTKPIPIEPRYFEVHFYQDGHIEVEATQESSDPRLKLERANYAERHEMGNVNNDEKFSRCKDGY